MHKPVHPIFNNRTRPVLIWALCLLIFIAFTSSVTLFFAWRDMYRGTVYGKIIDIHNTTMNNGPVSNSTYSPFPKYNDAVQRVKIEWYGGRMGSPNSIVITSATDTYQCINQVPYGYPLTVTTISASGTRIKDSVVVKRDEIPTQLNLTRAPMAFPRTYPNE